MEAALRDGLPEFDDSPNKEGDGKVDRLFRLPSSKGVLRRAILQQTLSASANHAGEIKVVTAWVETTPVEPQTR